jgi:hypothetical protein
MGRGVSKLSNANEVLYFDVSHFGMYIPTDDEGNEIEGAEEEYNEDCGHDDFEMFVDEIKCLLQKRYPSLYESDRRFEGEDKFILENNICEFAIAEYCGVFSLSIRAKEDEHYNTHKGDNWINRIEDGLKKAIKEEFGDMCMFRIGGLSDGTSVYHK